MHWWHGASLSKSHSNGNEGSGGSSKPGFFSSKRNRPFSHGAVARRAPENDGRHSPAAPLPLPLPELRDTKSGSPSSGSMPLPAPAANGVINNSRLVDVRMLVKHSAMQPSRKGQILPEKSSKKCSVNHPASAPASPHASTEDMLETQYLTLPSSFHGWDAQMHNSFSFDSTTSLLSPRANAQSPALALSPPRPVSPLPTRRESNLHTNVHPLPLPPGAAQLSSFGSKSDCSGAPTPSQSTPVPASPSRSKSDLKPMKTQWQKGKLIGRGTFGRVYVASNRETGALCAMKEVELLPDDPKSADCLRQLEQEIKVLSQLKHPNIVQYYGSEIVSNKFHIYLEYVHPGSINKFIHDHFGAMTESVVRNFTRHILCGLAYLHGTKTIHRDIKGANLLVDAYGVVKLADFGLAKHLHEQTAKLSLKGSPHWMAPELLQPTMQAESSSDLAYAIDIWSLGCTIIEMMDGKPPWSKYEGPAAMFKVLKETPPIPETMTPEGKDFLQCCFRRNPADRPTARQLLDHPFMSHTHGSDPCMQPHENRGYCTIRERATKP